MIQNPLREGFHMSYFSMFLKNCTCVKNSFKSATTTTAARVFKIISQRLDPCFCMTLRVRGWGGTVDLLLKSLAGWKKPIKESAFSQKPQSVFDWLGSWNPHENANSHPGSTLPNLASSIRAQVFVLGGGWPEEGRGGWGWCQPSEEEVRERQRWHGGIVCSEEDFWTTRSERGKRKAGPTCFWNCWWGSKCTTKEERHYEDCGTQKVSHISKSNASVSNSQSKRNFKIEFGNNFERKATFVMWLWPVWMVHWWKPTRWSRLAPVPKSAFTDIDLRRRISFPCRLEKNSLREYSEKLFFSTANNLGIWKHFITFKGCFRILSARAFIWAISQCS